jgi:uncharacterized protein (TIGR04141 family)
VHYFAASPGEADEEDDFSRITGSTSVQVTTELAFADLAEILDQLLEAYSDDAYRENFGWVDNVREVDPLLHADLDQRLVQAIQAGEIEGHIYRHLK